MFVFRVSIYIYFFSSSSFFQKSRKVPEVADGTLLKPSGARLLRGYVVLWNNRGLC